MSSQIISFIDLLDNISLGANSFIFSSDCWVNFGSLDAKAGLQPNTWFVRVNDNLITVKFTRFGEKLIVDCVRSNNPSFIQIIALRYFQSE